MIDQAVSSSRYIEEKLPSAFAPTACACIVNTFYCLKSTMKLKGRKKGFLLSHSRRKTPCSASPCCTELLITLPLESRQMRGFGRLVGQVTHRTHIFPSALLVMEIPSRASQNKTSCHQAILDTEVLAKTDNTWVKLGIPGVITI